MFFGTSVFSYSQNAKDYSIYVGRVEGITKQQFIDTINEVDLWRDSLLQISPIVKSNYPIEIRLYESLSGSAVQSCTILYWLYYKKA